MSSTQLRQYIDILKEDDFSTFSNFGFGPDTTAPTTKSPKTATATTTPPKPAATDAVLTRPGDKGKYKIVSSKPWGNNPSVTVVLSSRINLDGTTSYNVRGIDVKNNTTYYLPTGTTNTSDDLNTMKGIFDRDLKLDGPYEIISPNTIQGMLRNALMGGSTAAPTAPAAEKPADKEQPADKDQPADDATAIQQALVDAGFELPRFGVDGKIGPETRSAIKAAEMVIGRKPTGTITVKEIEVIKNKGAAADNNSLASALGAIEAVLAKYKIKTESIEEQIDAYILKNINEYSQQEQLEIWRTLTETDTSNIPAYMRKGTDQFANPNPNKLSSTVATATPAEKTRMQWDPQTKNYYSVDSKGTKTYQGVLTPKQSKLAKFAGKLGGAKGIGKKLVTRAGATALSGPAALAVGTGLAAWTAYDIGKALYDTFASTEIADLDPADQKIITDNLKTVMAYEQDPKMLATLPNELQLRVSNVAKGLNSLAVDVGAVTPPSTTTAEKPPAPQSTSKSEPTVTTKNEYRIANELVVPGQPLSQKQMAVIKMSMDMGNSYPPEVMAQYNKQKQTA